MIYKVILLGKVLAQFKDDFERARDYADRFPATEDVEVEEDGRLVFIKFNK
jgi:hypothetical protein